MLSDSKGQKGQTITLRHSDKLKENGELELFTGLWFPEKFERDEPFIHCDTPILAEETALRLTLRPLLITHSGS